MSFFKRYVITMFVLVIAWVGIRYDIQIGSFKLEMYYNDKALEVLHANNLECSISINQIRNVRIGIIDTGFRNYLESTGILNLIPLNQSNQYVSNENHGIVVASIIGAMKHDGINYQGLLPGQPLYVYDIPPEDLNADNLARAIDVMTEHHIDVINISLGTFADSTKLKQAVEHAVDQGVLIIASSGNHATDSYNYPASYNLPGVLSVGALSEDLNILPTTNVNDRVTIYAPGQNIASIQQSMSEINVKQFSGTSVSAPFITTLVAIVKAKYPNKRSAEIKEYIIKSSDHYTGRWGAYDRNVLLANFNKTINNS